jgi:isocitrate/isopropylmalate dehydrogenase
MPATLRERRLELEETLVDFLVSNMALSSDFGGVVVLADVFRDVIALRSAHDLGLFGLTLRTLAGDDRGSGGYAPGTGSQQEITAGKLANRTLHHTLLAQSNPNGLFLGDKFTLRPVPNQSQFD